MVIGLTFQIVDLHVVTESGVRLRLDWEAFVSFLFTVRRATLSSWCVSHTRLPCWVYKYLPDDFLPLLSARLPCPWLSETHFMCVTNRWPSLLGPPTGAHTVGTIWKTTISLSLIFKSQGRAQFSMNKFNKCQTTYCGKVIGNLDGFEAWDSLDVLGCARTFYLLPSPGVARHGICRPCSALSVLCHGSLHKVLELKL